ncbi:MAG: hypothetical protein L6R41_003052 [Letrouitia leprolyta]|nr:MAG: hypothetical protein L6R41_003052 [Letrouitia leprolyta]
MDRQRDRQISFPFLQLSRELRNSIYELLLLSKRERPLSLEHGNLRRYSDSADKIWFRGRDQYLAENLINPIVPLQLTCGQIHDEGQDAIIRIQRSGCLTFELDIIMLHETELYPTWLSIPVVTDTIPKLKVGFRFFAERKGHTGGWRSRGGAPPNIIGSLFTLLKRFLLRGPNFFSPIKRKRMIKVDELSINLQTPSTWLNNEWCELTGSMYRLDSKTPTPPQRVMGGMTYHLGLLLKGSKYPVNHAQLLFQRIKRITFTLDGEEQESWDMTMLERDFPIFFNDISFTPSTGPLQL